MEPTPEALVMYGAPSEAPPVAWSWVEEELTAAGTYWVVPGGSGPPHPRPVWGVWERDRLHLSIGSPGIRRRLEEQPDVAVHLDSGTDVVIIEGRVAGPCEAPAAIARYDAKYDWSYSVEEYGPLTEVVAARVITWRSAGRAGRDGFHETARWHF